MGTGSAPCDQGSRQMTARSEDNGGMAGWCFEAVGKIEDRVAGGSE